MVALPEPKNRTAAAIYARHERDAEDWRREHLGASVVGDGCARHLWYTFHWASDPHFGGRILRLFERGQREEEWVVEELRLVGMTVHDRDESRPVDPGTGEHPQYRFEAIGGHFGGGCDGAVLGVLEAPKTWHLLEVKTSNERRFKELQKDGVAKAQPRHHAQLQCYMHGLKLKRALYVCVCKNDDRIYTERVHYSRREAEAVLRVAEAVVSAPNPLSKINEDPAWFECRFCDHRGICHLEQVELLERNCRTCASSTPLPDGRWTCAHHGTELDGAAQRAGCGDHLFIPALLPWQPVDFDEARRAVTYATPQGNVTDTGTELVAIP